MKKSIKANVVLYIILKYNTKALSRQEEIRNPINTIPFNKNNPVKAKLFPK